MSNGELANDFKMNLYRDRPNVKTDSENNLPSHRGNTTTQLNITQHNTDSENDLPSHRGTRRKLEDSLPSHRGNTNLEDELPSHRGTRRKSEVSLPSHCGTEFISNKDSRLDPKAPVFHSKVTTNITNTSVAEFPNRLVDLSPRVGRGRKNEKNISWPILVFS